jgi:hypothetical protein
MITHINTKKLKGKWFKIAHKCKDCAIILIGGRLKKYSWVEFKDAFIRNPENPNEVQFKEVKLAKMEETNRLLTNLAITCKMIDLTNGQSLSMYLALNDDFKKLQELTEVSVTELVTSIQEEMKWQERKLESDLLGIPMKPVKKSKGIKVNDSLKNYDTQNTKNGKEMGTSGFSIKAIMNK